MRMSLAVVAAAGMTCVLSLQAQSGRASVAPQFRVHIIDRNLKGITGGAYVLFMHTVSPGCK